MIESLNHLKDFISAENQLSEKEWNDFASIWDEFSVKRKEIITNSNKTEKYLYFITSGAQRVFYYDHKEREATLIFTYPYSFGGVVDSFLLQEPSKYIYESLTTSSFLRTTHNKLEMVTKMHPNIDSVIKKITYYAFSGLLERMTELQCFSSEDKFKILLKRSPHILQLVPHKYLANYLGIDHTNFSKLLNNVKI